jgi:hypothetical protein
MWPSTNVEPNIGREQGNTKIPNDITNSGGGHDIRKNTKLIFLKHKNKKMVNEIEVLIS